MLGTLNSWHPNFMWKNTMSLSLQSEAKLQPIYHMNYIACINMELLLNQVEFQVYERLTWMQPPALNSSLLFVF
ncbi:hypothetical protein ACJIZ3_023059 [Penstemon smallii]|uniref:Uncharacterized protein n=1 Tax=Penstemon smallii TaxID=265156 RepID=A0ABD3TQB9_9LAMI